MSANKTEPKTSICSECGDDQKPVEIQVVGGAGPSWCTLLCAFKALQRWGVGSS